MYLTKAEEKLSAETGTLANSQVMNKIIDRSEEHTSELQSRETISYAVFCLKKKNCEEREDK